MAIVDGDGNEINDGAGPRRAGRSGRAVGGYSLSIEASPCPPFPTPPPVVYVQTSGPTTAAASIALGAGIVRPFRRTEHRDFANDAGPPEVLSCVGQLLGTRKGSLPWRVDFGAALDQLRHKNRTGDLLVYAQKLVDDALRQFEPRAQVASVEINPDAQPNELGLKISVKIGTSVKTLTI